MRNKCVAAWSSCLQSKLHFSLKNKEYASLVMFSRIMINRLDVVKCLQNVKDNEGENDVKVSLIRKRPPVETWPPAKETPQKTEQQKVNNIADCLS